MIIYNTKKVEDLIGLENAFVNMIDYFFSLSDQGQRILIPHALGQYLGKKYFNISDRFEFSEDEVCEFAERFASFISNNFKKAFILDIKKVSDLAFKYANYYSKLVYHEAVPSRLEIRAKMDNGISVSYGYEGIALDEFISKEEIEYINSNVYQFVETQEAVATGLKFVKAQLA